MLKKIRVSILVIVEVTLKYTAHILSSSKFLCFNPCYSGSNSKINNEES